MKKRLIIALAIVLAILITSASYIVITNISPNNESISNNSIPIYVYPTNVTIIRPYPHDATAFTEGLVYDNGFLYEGTGLNGNSTLRKTNLETGQVLQEISLEPQFFGEGITIFENKIIQLTWQSQTAFVYDKDSFSLLQEFTYRGEGWGITHDDTKLIMSNGSNILTFLDPTTFKVTGTVKVTDNGTAVTNLNELEYINGTIYANVWLQDKIAIINIQTGNVTAWINLAGIYPAEYVNPDNVLNGIAYDPAGSRLFVTGKRWNQLFEIRLGLA